MMAVTTRTWVFIVVLTLTCGFLVPANASRILCLLPMCARSHYNVFVPLVEALAARGHHVSVMSPFKDMEDPNIVEIALPNSLQAVGKAQKNMFDYLIGEDKFLLSVFTPSLMAFCNAFTTEDSVKELLQGSKNNFDLVILDGVLNECARTIAPLVGKTLITLNPTGQVPWEYTNTPVPPSAVPMGILPYSDHMSFFQRMMNTWTQLKNRIYYQYFIIPKTEKIVFPKLPQALTVEEATRHISLTLTNTDPVMFAPRPQTPDLVLVGAMHCRPAKPLPHEFSEFMKKAKENGAIVFTLGSFVPAKDMPLKLRAAFLAAFARLKQVVFWKFEESIADMPSNVMATSWLPQQDLLGHNHTRLLITHGGLLSSQEAIYHGVPIIGIPLFYDQIGNVARIQELGIGEKLRLENLNEDKIYDTIQRLLNDRRYSENMRKYSSILRDQPQKPTDRAVYWTEYVIRHEGAHHLKPPALELSFIQYFLLDVAACATILIVTILIVLSYLVRCFIKYWERPAKMSSTKKTS